MKVRALQNLLGGLIEELLDYEVVVYVPPQAENSGLNEIKSIRWHDDEKKLEIVF